MTLSIGGPDGSDNTIDGVRAPSYRGDWKVEMRTGYTDCHHKCGTSVVRQLGSLSILERESLFFIIFTIISIDISVITISMNTIIIIFQLTDYPCNNTYDIYFS